ncbi:unnamed protein product [Calicophoron daubneyi]|uniref:CCAAT-binding factor domain-containing protein n=1 Tax=Calicophoron daubneyi TaxID=300641 RepID=A0AAV2T201_CALDB
MGLEWFSDKKSCLSGPPVSTDECCKWREKVKEIWNRRYPPFELAGSLASELLMKESIATKEWLFTSLRSSTGQDRICAMAYLVNLLPTRCLRYIDALISLVTPAKQRDCVRAIDALYQLFIQKLLPRHRTMISFGSRPFNLLHETKLPDEDQETLCLWYFEDELKIRYLSYVKSLERLLLSDTVEAFKHKALGILSALVTRTPEDRSLILSVIINKLGDRSKVLASSVIHKLRTLAGNRALTEAVIQEVHTFLFRPNLLERAKYYAIAFLSCIQIERNRTSDTSTSAANVALSLVKIYAAFFHATVKSAEIPERLASALLTGLGRAAPFIPEDRLIELVEEVDDIFRLVHAATFNVSLQALAVLFQLSMHRPEIRDRYYQALYRKLTNPSIAVTSRGPSLLHLLYRSLLNDPDAERRAAFTQRLLQICVSHPQPGFVVGCLILLSKVDSAKGHLIVRSQIPVDTQQMIPPSGSQPLVQGSDDEEESFSDAPESDSENLSELPVTHETSENPPANVVSSWDYRQLMKIVNPKKKHSASDKSTSVIGYDPHAREPLFSRAGGYPCWALVILSNHVHPTISLFAKSLLSGQPLAYTGDPFDDFTLLHFLDRFSYKKPKVGTVRALNSKKQKLPPGPLLQRKLGPGCGSRSVPVNSAMFRQLSVDRVPADEQFFHNYFKLLESRVKKPSRAKQVEESDESVSDEEFDEYLEKYEKGLIPADEDAEDDEVELNDAEFSDNSRDGDGAISSGDEELFADMDGISSHNTKAATGATSTMDYDLENSSDDDFDNDLPGKRRSNIKSKLESLFASADEVGRLYGAEKKKKDRKRRVWEERRTRDDHRMPKRQRTQRGTRKRSSHA